MKLAAKLMLVFLAVVMLMTAVGSYFSVRRAFERFERRQQRLARETADAMNDKLANAYQHGGAASVLEAMKKIQLPDSQHHIRWVWFEQTQVADGRSRSAVFEQLRIAGTDVVTKTFRDEAGRRHLQTVHPLDLGDSPRGGLEVTGPLDALDAETSETIINALFSLGSMALASLGLVYLAGVRWVTRPLNRLVAKTERIASGDFSDPLPAAGTDELSQLARALNHMSEQLAIGQQRIRDEAAARLATLEQLRHADRLKTVGRLAAGLAHELGTPLNVVSGRASLIASGKLSPDEVTASAETIKGEAERVTAIIRQLLDFARPSKSQRRPLDLGELLQQTVALIEPLAEKRGVRIETEAAPGCSVSADRSQLQQVLTNILVNAVQAMPDGGTATARLTSGDARLPGDAAANVRPCAAIAISDQGEGIAAEDMQQIFEPFFTTKDVGEGTGLGLSIAYGIVQEHGGWIDVASQPHQGSCFTVYLPRENAAGTELCEERST